MFAMALLGVFLMAGMSREAKAESVDAELLLLVDVSSSGLKSGEFDALMDGYADALTSSQVIDSIQAGNVGRIAVSLVLFGGSPMQAQGVEWMSIGSLAEAQNFADQLRALPPPSSGNFTYAESLAHATTMFGSETGYAGNGFESAVQIIEVAGASKPKGPSGSTEQATADALNAGVDLIGATALGKKGSQVESYYATYVVGGEVGGVTGSATSGEIAAGLEIIIADQISGGLNGAVAVPEPSMPALLMASAGFFVLLRRRRS